MGCRVIFSCLKELAKHLPKINTEEPPAVRNRSVAAGKGDTAEDADEDCDGESSYDESERASEETQATETPAASTADSEAPKKKGLLGHAAALTTGVLSAGAKVGGAIVNPVVSRIRRPKSGTAQAARTCPLAPHELKSLIGDVVLLGAPLNLRVSLPSNCVSSLPRTSIAAVLAALL